MSALYRGPLNVHGYILTLEDCSILAQVLREEYGDAMTEREAGAVAWCMIMRYLLVRGRWMDEGWDFSHFIRTRNQKGIQVQDQVSLIPHNSDAVKYAQAFVEGKLPNPFYEPVYDFAACSLIRKQSRPGDGINIGGNCYLRMADLRHNEREDVVPGQCVLGLPRTKAVNFC